MASYFRWVRRMGQPSVIRTAGNPLRSRPSLPLAAATILVVLIGVARPFTPLAATPGFESLPGAYFSAG